jgi:hypothetical protein
MPTLNVTQPPGNALFTAKSIQWLESGDLRFDLWLDGSSSAEFLDLQLGLPGAQGIAFSSESPSGWVVLSNDEQSAGTRVFQLSAYSSSWSPTTGDLYLGRMEIDLSPGQKQQSLIFWSGVAGADALSPYVLQLRANSAPTGTVTITGTATQGQTLTASNTLGDIDGLGTISYQWRANGADIEGATGSTLTLTQAQVGKTITVVASYTDQHKATESVTSVATGAVSSNVPSTPTEVLRKSPEDALVQAKNIQWLSSGDLRLDLWIELSAPAEVIEFEIGLSGAPALTFTPAYSDKWVTANNQELIGEARVLRLGGYSASSSPVSGEFYVGRVDLDLPVGQSRQTVMFWSGAAGTNTLSPYTLEVKGNTVPTGTVTVEGVLKQGQTLTASNNLADEDGLGVISYQWQAGGANITGATGTSFTLTQAQVGQAITVVASYTDQMNTAESVTSAKTALVANVNDQPTGSVKITGTATQGQTLTASNTLADADGLGTISYQWQAGGANIAGATGTSFTLTQAQVGKAITVVASYTDQQNTAESVSSAATNLVANVNDQPTGSVTIAGTATQGQTLTASNTLADVDGLGAISYQWRADGTNIAGATGTSLTLTQAQVGKAITVVASYTDQLNTAESLSSAATTAIVDINDAPTGTDKTVTTQEGTAYQFSSVDFGFNDVDPGDMLGAVRIDTLPDSSKGTLKLGSSPVAAGQVIEAAQITNLKFEPIARLSGTALASFNFSVRDAQLFDISPQMVTLDVSPAPWIETSGHVYHWKNHALLAGANLIARSMMFDSPANALFDFRQLQYTDTNILQAEVWLTTATSVDDISVTLSADASVSISFTPGQTLDGWTVESNAEILDNRSHLLVAGFTQSQGKNIGGATKLGDVQFDLAAVSAEPIIGFAASEAGGVDMKPYEVALPWAQSTSTSSGLFALSVPDEGPYQVRVNKSLTAQETGPVISAADALAALKLSVGINPNSVPAGTGLLTAPPVSPYQFLAADVNGDGRVSAADALAILKMAVKRNDAPSREWLFVNEAYDLWNESAPNGGAFTTTRIAVPKDAAMPRSVEITDGSPLNLVAVLKGDVNGNWAAPTGSTALPDSYFQALVGNSPLTMNLAQFGVVNTGAVLG